MARRREIRSDASAEDWQAFLRELESASGEDAGPAGADGSRRADRAWLTENGDPIDPEAFFVLFTGIE